jgi:glycosyltransferase involved in cell wall biosynthesis
MNVLHIIPSYLPFEKYGGPIYSTHLLCKYLFKKGINVTVFTTARNFEKEKMFDNIKVKYFKYYGYEHYNFSPALFKKLSKEIKNYDLIHITAVWNFPVFIGAYLSRKSKIPYIISPIGTLDPHVVKNKSYIVKKLYYNLISKRDLKKASLIHYTTEYEKHKTEKYFKIKNKGVVIPRGIEFEEFEKENKNLIFEKIPYLKNKKYILFLSRINWKKGLDILIPAFHKISKDFKDIYLVITGPDNEGYGKKVRKWVKDYELEKRVIFTGPLYGEEKISILKNSEIFVLSSYSENFGMAVVEAMACGIPVLISDRVGIYKEVKRYNAGIITQTNEESVYKGIKTFLENRSLAQKISGNAKRLVKDYYDINKVAEKMIKIYEKVISSTK